MAAPADTDPIHAAIEHWHRALRGDLAAELDLLLHDDVVFSSPVVFTPQKGKDLTTMYLLAAYSTFGGSGAAGAESGPPTGSKFRYVRQVLDGHDAVLEFETEIDGTYINGADFITCDDDGRITDFKVMLRPLRAVNTMHELMRAMLESMG